MKLNLDRLSEYPIVAPDVETTGFAWAGKDEMFGVAIAAWDGKRVVSGYWDIRNSPRVLEHLKREIPKCKLLVNHNAKFDAHFMRKAGIRVPIDRFECTSVRAALINEHEPSFSLDALGKYVDQHKAVGVYEKLAEMFGGKPTRETQMKNLHRAPESLAREYATPDPEIALKLWRWQEDEIERQDLHQIWSLERALTPVLVEIEEFGIRVDEGLARRQQQILERKIEEAQLDLNRLAGNKWVNANSPKQVRELFQVEKRDGDWWTGKVKLVETESGNPSMDKDAMEILEKFGDERAVGIQTLRKYTKAQQFLEGHILGHAIDGRLYANYNQMRGDNDRGTVTGRLSINDPALHQIPARDKDIAALVRSCFLPEEGEVWASADWEQFEFRWFAHYTRDEVILKAYADDPRTDYHTVVSNITGIPRNATHAGAANAKQINLGLVFGMGQGEMAYQMGLDYNVRRDESGREWKIAGPRAKAIFATYHDSIPGVRRLLDEASSIARARGFVKTAHGRRIRFLGGKFTHKAAGLVFQGTSADCMKMKMIELHGEAKRHGYHYLLSVHDEHNASIPKQEVKLQVPQIRNILQSFGEGDPIACRVPILSSIKTGVNWWEACKKD